MSLSNNKEFFIDHEKMSPLSHSENNTFHNSLSRFQIVSNNVDQISRIYNFGTEGKERGSQNEGEAESLIGVRTKHAKN
jgi:hypothetical protein